MPQTGQRVAAPTDPNPQWPAGYVAALSEAGAQEKTIPYYIAWVRRFFGHYPGRRRRELGRAEIETFLAAAAARPDVTNWQVQQARDALELYYERFRGITLAPRTDIPKSHAPSSITVSSLEVARNDSGPKMAMQIATNTLTYADRGDTVKSVSSVFQPEAPRAADADGAGAFATTLVSERRSPGKTRTAAYGLSHAAL